MGRNSNESHDRWQRKAYDSILIKVRKEKQYPVILDIAATKHGISRTQYIINAIDRQLQLDGITVDSLPDQAESVKHD
jgi:hypothetical protein